MKSKFLEVLKKGKKAIELWSQKPWVKTWTAIGFEFFSFAITQLIADTPMIGVLIWIVITVACVLIYLLIKLGKYIYARQRENSNAGSTTKPAWPVQKKAMWITVIVVILGTVLCAISLLNIKTSYYNTIVERFGLPYGVGVPLTKEEQASMTDYWLLKENRFTKKITATFVTQSGPLDLLEANSTLYSMNILREPASIVYTYQGSARAPVVSQAEYRCGENTLLVLDYQTDSAGNLDEIVNIISYPSSEGQRLLQGYLFCVPSDVYRALLPATTIAVRYYDNGLPRERILLEQAMAYGARNGVFGERYKYDDKGRLEQLTFLGENETPKSYDTGAMALRFSYTDYDQLEQIRYYADSTCQTPTENRGVHVDAFEYDENMYNLIGRSFRDRDGNILPDQNGVYTYQYEYAGQSLVRESYLGVSGQEIYVTQQQGASKDYTYKSRNRIFQVTTNQNNLSFEASLPTSLETDDSFEAVYAIAIVGDSTGDSDVQTEDGNVFGGSTEYAGVPSVSSDIQEFTTVYELDKQGRVERESYLNNAALPTTNNAGYASIKYSYDKKTGNRSSIAYFDLDGKPFVHNGYSSVAYEYDADGNVVRENYLLDGNLTINFDQGYATREIVYRKGEPISRTGILYQSVIEKYLDTAGQPVFSKNGYQERLRLYDSGGQLGYEYYCEVGGKLTPNRDGYAGIKYIHEQGRVIRKEYLDSNETLTINSSVGYAIITTSYDEQTGQTEQVRYLDTDGKTPLLDKTTGTSGYRNVFVDGNITKVTYLGLNGQPTCRKDEGYAVLEQVYNSNNNVRWVFYYDTDGITPVLQTTTWAAAIRIEYVEGSNKISDRYYYGPRVEGKSVSNRSNPESWKPILNKTEGTAHIHYDHDHYGNLEQISYFGLEDGVLTLTKDGGYAIRVQRFDQWNRFTGSDYLDINGEKILHKTLGYATHFRDLDNAGNLLGESYYGINGERILATDEKVAGYTYTYYTTGKLSGLCASKRFFGVEGPEDLVLNDTTWAAEYVWEYDDFGRECKGTFIGKDGELVARRYSGFTTWEYHYDRRGNQDICYYYNADGKLMNLPDGGYAYWRKEYRDDSLLIRQTYYDANKEKAFNKENWYSSIEWGYDRFGRTENVSYLDTGGDPTLNKEKNIARHTITYHDDGMEKEHRYYDTAGNLSPRQPGNYAIVKYEYIGRTTRTSYWGAENEPCLTLQSEGWYSNVVTEFDARGLEIRSTYRDANGNPAVDGKYGCSQTLSSYNEWGEVATQTYLTVDEDGEFMPISRKDRGYAYLVNRYDIFGRYMGAEFYGTDCKTPIINKETGAASFIYNRNLSGNIQEERYFDAGGQPVLRKGGYSWLQRTYDDKQRMTGIEYFDTRNKPVISTYGYAAYTQSFYDSNNLAKETTYQGTDGNPMLVQRDGWGYAIIQRSFNDRGLMESEKLYNDAEKPSLILKDQQYAQAIFEYDTLGNETSAIYYDEHGDKTIFDRGYARRESVYDGANLVERKIYDVNDSQLPINSYYYSRHSAYDYLGRIIIVEDLDKYGSRIARDDSYAYIKYTYSTLRDERTVRYYYADGTPADQFGFGVAVTRNNYDLMGREILYTYLDQNDKPVISNYGYARLETKYNSRGLVAWKEYQDTNGDPIIPKGKDYARVEYHYDALGRTELIGYFDAEDNPAIIKDGYSKISILYELDNSRQTISFLDGQGVLTRLHVPDPDGEDIIKNNHKGYAVIVLDYDAWGNESRVSYLDEFERPVALNHHDLRPSIDSENLNGVILPRQIDIDSLFDIPYAIVKTEYDAHDRVTKRAYFSDDTTPINAEACTMYMYYDDITNQVASERFVNASGQEINHDILSYSMREIYWDRSGSTDDAIRFSQTITYYNADGTWCVNSDGYHLEWIHYNELAQPYKRSYWGLSGDDDDPYEPAINNALGYASVTYEYDAYGHVKLEQYWDKENRLVVSQEDGAATIKREFDEWGNIVLEQFTGKNGELVIPRGYNYAKVERSYDNYGNFVEENLFNASGGKI